MVGKELAGRYRIVREIGRGGMGAVYLAEDPKLEREVAVKVIHPEAISADNRKRFEREARVVAKMDHPGIVPVHDVGEDEDSLFLVMPFVSGTNLRTFLDEGDVSLGDVVEIGIAVAEALDYSHELGVVHRDIKPENIMVERAGDQLRVRITDFGIAAATFEQRVTNSRVIVGTVQYLSPEQVDRSTVD